VFVVSWLWSRRRLRKPVRLKLLRLVAVSGLVAATLSASAETRLADNQNLILEQRVPLAAGFYTVAAEAVPAVRYMDVTCLSDSDCVATGLGSYYGSNPWADRALLATSTNGGTTWRVGALPASISSTGPPTCGARSCDISLISEEGGPRRELVVSFNAHGPARIDTGAAPPQPLGASTCLGNRWLAFVPKQRAHPPAPIITPPRGQTVSVWFAWYTTDGGGKWISTLLPVAHRLPGAHRGATAIYRPDGPWCTDALHCAGAEGVQPTACALSGSTGPHCEAQLTMLYTSDGGKEWSTERFAVGKPDLDGVTCDTPRIASASPPSGTCSQCLTTPAGAGAPAAPLHRASSAGALPVV
jgi:hypothetical protein